MRSVKELMNLNGRVVVITGGAGHIGSVMGEALAEAGAHIVLIDQNQAMLDEVSQTLKKKYSAEVLSLKIDLGDQQQTKSIPEKVLREFGRMDVLLMCAALVGTSDLKGWSVPFPEQSVDTWRKAIDINLTSVFILAQASYEALKASEKGVIITIGSLYAMLGPDWNFYEGTKLGNPAAYSASKGGVLQLTRWLATTVAPNVRANAISIGGVYRGHQDPFLKKFVEKTPLGRMATEEDLKGAALYLASDLSQYVTGHNLVVDGGFSIW